MLRRCILLLIVLIGCGLCTNDDNDDSPIEMTQWAGGPTWQDRPSWRAVVDMSGKEGHMTQKGVLKAAERAWTWLAGSPGTPENAAGGKPRSKLGRARVVAALYIADNKKLYISTAPLGPLQGDITRHAVEAPTWLNQVKPIWDIAHPFAKGKNFWHAEDACYFMYEKEDGGPGINKETQKYPPFSIVATYGDDLKMNNVGAPFPLCSDDNDQSRSVRCQAVANGLGVAFPSVDSNKVVTFTDVYDDSDESFDQNLLAQCEDAAEEQGQPPAVRGRDLQRRFTNFSCPYDPDSTTYPIQKVSFAASDFDSGSAITTFTTEIDTTALPAVTLNSPSSTTATEAASSKATITSAPTLPASCTTCHTSSSTGTVTVIAGSSPVHVGTLTGSALATSVSSAMEKLCPTVGRTNTNTTCSTKSVSIKNIPYKDSGGLSMGELVVTVEAGSYNDTKLRDVMIKTAARSFQLAANGTNCYNETYLVESLGKRDNGTSPPSMRFLPRDHPEPVEEHATWCNTIGFADVNYYDPFWRVAGAGASDHLEVHLAFQVSPSGLFACEILADAEESLSFVLGPEFAAAGFDIGEAITVACEEEDGR